MRKTLLGIIALGSLLVGGACGHAPEPSAVPTAAAAEPNVELPLSPAEIDARRPLLKRSATRWMLLDGAEKLTAIDDAGFTDRVWRQTQAKYAGRDDIRPPERVAVAVNLRNDVDAFFQLHQSLIVSWSIEELILGSARHFDWNASD